MTHGRLVLGFIKVTPQTSGEVMRYVQLLGNPQQTGGTPWLTRESRWYYKVQHAAGLNEVKFLGVGDSWMRDSLCELWPVLNAAGKIATIGHDAHQVRGYLPDTNDGSGSSDGGSKTNPPTVPTQH